MHSPGYTYIKIVYSAISYNLQFRIFVFFFCFFCFFVFFLTFHTMCSTLVYDTAVRQAAYRVVPNPDFHVGNQATPKFK